MDRRGFFRILSATSAGALAGGCGRNSEKLIPLLVPDHEIVPGEEQWHPAVCTECGAGCGTLVRVMEAVRTVERNGEQVRQPIAAVKKVEGNPLDPVSGGRLCARGQATVQALYHPDRLRGPMKRTGDRGQAQFAAITWDEALALASDAIAKARAVNPGGIVALTRPLLSNRSLALQRFMEALGAPPPVVCSIADLAVERKAAEMAFGWKGLPVYDLANANFALGVGADFLGGWASPVYYARQFGNFRQGRREVRGTLVQAESRLSITAASADRWLPLRPGSEPQFLAAVGRMLLDLRLARNPEHLPPAVLSAFQSADVRANLASCGLPENRVRDLVQALGESEAPLVLGGASIVQTNSLAAIVASHCVNLMLGNVGRKGGVLPPAGPPSAGFSGSPAHEAMKGARVVLLDAVNPAYTLPPASGVLDALSRAGMVIGLSGFVDDSSAFADLLLPAHHALESELAVVPAVSPQPAVSIGMPFVEPLYDTRAPETVFSGLARSLKLEYQPVTSKEVVEPFLSAGTSFEDAARQGGAWSGSSKSSQAKSGGQAIDFAAAAFDGDATYPMQFQPYLSLQFHDGRGSNLPWLQELPDPASSAIWGLPVEIDPATAKMLRVANGDIVRVQSPHGGIDAPAYIHPGAVPGVVSMAVGDGHAHYGRFASGRGANPLSILAPVWEKSTGALALGATRVRLARVGSRRDWIQFSAPDREERDFGHR
ncbi:MAG TPA: molybdopterin-dependent oxidoreductase [Candidatus Acidoferrales bacterium]|nr:molybdopterin-dependent oxidoreductase [Candidatus Acidoferrales bacterium]